VVFYKKCLIWLMTLLLFLSSVPSYSKAKTNEKNSSVGITSNEDKIDSKEVPKTKKSKKREIIKQRTDKTKVYDNGDGTFTKKVFFEPVHRKENGEWKEISSVLTDDDKKGIETENTLINAVFNKKMENGEYATFSFGEESISFSILEAAGSNKKADVKDVKPSLKGNELFHKGIFPGVNLRNLTFDQSVKEDIVLDSYTGFNTFKFKLNTSLEAKEQKNGSVAFYKKGTTNPVFVLPKPYMTDSNIDKTTFESVRSENVNYTLTKEDEGYLLTVTADDKWLKDPARKYPVYIDPTTSIETSGDAFVTDRYKDNNYGTADKKWSPSLNEYALSVGYTSGTGTNYTYLKQDIGILNNANIESAELNVYVTQTFDSVTKNGMWLDRVSGTWSPSSLTWNNKPASVNIGNVTVGQDQWAKFNVLTTVKEWVNGTRPNYGFKLHANGNGESYWKKVVSSDNPTYKPFLAVTYSYNAPDTPVVEAKSNGPGSNTGHLNINWNKVTGATGYKIHIYNGFTYDKVTVGDVSSWSTNGKNLWPTEAQYTRGEYWLRNTDKDGGEFAFNPMPVYQAAERDGGLYGNRRNYVVRVSAIYPGGESPASPGVLPFMPMETPHTPTGRPYPNEQSEKSGYVNLEWKATPDAAGYKIFMFNGKDYEEVDDVPATQTSWTTQNKGIWPTEAQITQSLGVVKLNTEKNGTKGNGTELAIDPSPVYNKAASGYEGKTNYWFRIKAYSNNSHPESAISYAYMPTMPGADPFLGMEDYWTGIDVENGTVNAATGNLIISDTDVSIKGRGPGLGIERTYNSKSTAIGLFGRGWHSDAEMKMVANGNEVKFTDEDGTIHRFLKQADNSYQPPTGVYLELQETTNDYILTSKDQSKVYFDKLTGNVLKMVDGHGNTTTYTFINNKLQTIKDASGRTLTFEYNPEGYVSKITDPKTRITSYQYQGEQLVSVTNPEAEETRYEYDGSGFLLKLIEPTNTADVPVFTTYSYDDETDNRIETITNPKGKITNLEYEFTNRKLTVIHPKINKTSYEFNPAANPIKMVKDADGLKLTTTYLYEGNNLKESRDPKDQGAASPTESYQYDAEGNVINSTDSYGTESYSYNSNNDVTSFTDTEGDVTSIAYDGLDPVSEADLAGKSSSVAKYDAYGNLTQSSDELGTATNELLNNSFEDGLTSWVKVTSLDSGTASADTTESYRKLGGQQSIKITPQTTSTGTEFGFIAMTQVLPASEETTYSLNGRIKTVNLKNANAYFNVQFIDPTGKAISYLSNRYSGLTGTKSWTERQLTFKTPANTANIKVFLEVDHKSNSTSGDAWFDAIQLEKSEVSSSYNPIINSSFEKDLSNWTGIGGSIDTQSFDGSKSLKYNRTSTTQSDNQYKQTIIIGQKTGDEPLTLTLTGLSKAQNVVNSGSSEPNADYSLLSKVYYTDGTSEEFYAKYPLGTQEWNRAAVKIKNEQQKLIEKIEVLPTFRKGNTGTVWFDSIRLLEGNVLSKQTYDSTGNYVIESEDEIGRITTSSYDEIGRLLEEVNPKGIKKTFKYDASDRLTELLLSNNTKITYAYNKNGSMTTKSIFSTNENKTQKFEYVNDVNEQLVQVTDPLDNVTKYDYDDNGNKTKAELPNGKTIEWKYDGADRLHQILRNGVPRFEFGYDVNGNETSVNDIATPFIKNRVFDKQNRVTSITERGGKVDWTYPKESDKLQSVSITHGTHSETRSFVYNEVDQNTLVKDFTLTYRFDYDEHGNVRTYTAANGSGATYNYDDAGQVTSLSVGTASGDNILSERYTHDKNGNRTKIVGAEGTSTLYEYDTFDELTKETLPNGTIIDYQYDGFGNRTKVTKTKGSEITENIGEFNFANQLTKFGSEIITYDKNGNRTSDAHFNYEWNAADQLVAVTKKGETNPFATYEYDEDGRRIRKVVNGEVTNYFYDGDGLNVLYETDGNNNVVRSYIYSEPGELLAMKKGNQIYYYHFNGHGDVIGLTDSEGTKVASYSYDSWGNIISEQEAPEVKDNPYRYAGYQYDKETNLYYLMARYYASNHGVFLSVDPDSGDEDDLLTQNGYTYANNNPVMFVDPDGRWSWRATYQKYDKQWTSWGKKGYVKKNLGRRVRNGAAEGAVYGAAAGAGFSAYYDHISVGKVWGGSYHRKSVAKVGKRGGAVIGYHLGGVRAANRVVGEHVAGRAWIRYKKWKRRW
jgi:RHS repeat-associated protein